MKKMLISLILLSLLLCSCGLETTEDKEETYNHKDTFQRLEVNTKESYEEVYEEPKPNQNEAYKDTFTSNIDIDVEEIDIDLSEYEWFNIPDNVEMYYNVYQWITYGINTYYNENVSETFSCTIPDDIINQETNMIFTVEVHGDNTTLQIMLDMYNYKIIVNEV